MAKLFKSHLTQLRKVYHFASSRLTLSGTTLILGKTNEKTLDEALDHIREAIKLLDSIS